MCWAWLRIYIKASENVKTTTHFLRNLRTADLKIMPINLRDIKALLNRPSAKRVQTPAQEVEPNFSQVITQALAKIRAEDPEEARRTLLNEIIALESNDVSPDVTEPEVLAETVNKVDFTPRIESLLEETEAPNF